MHLCQGYLSIPVRHTTLLWVYVAIKVYNTIIFIYIYLNNNKITGSRMFRRPSCLHMFTFALSHFITSSCSHLSLVHCYSTHGQLRMSENIYLMLYDCSITALPELQL